MTPVVVLGAARLVGQTLLQRLIGHPMFSIRAVCDLGAERAPLPYGKACDWKLTPAMPAELQDLEHHCGSAETLAKLASHDALVLSVLPDGLSGPVDRAFANCGSRVITHAAECRLDADIPLIIPDIHEIPRDARIVATPNCTTVMLSLMLSAIRSVQEINAVSVVTLQALSGADLTGPQALEILNNVDPQLCDEALALERETARIFDSAFPVSAQCARVPVTVGHTLFVSFKMAGPCSRTELVGCLRDFRLPPDLARLPTAIEHPFVVSETKGRPRPSPDAEAKTGMGLTIGGLEPCSVLDWRCVMVGNNMQRGSAATLLLTAEKLTRRMAS
ncbi:aspartate semialdehyde dehydrogenase [Roseovarius lutimaris]|uniref:aspartate-semialdehyde dehydrogenase n=1 Tax=Roseovarius lutimaris TaxID=1005928 RepID=A0A1I5GYE8_9RHOB|nr:Asd/ArgC dimerization domain-containing protein [Roseovarius lutimaris]SFO40967.1 aspartate semialdehyde dehydrogenase [Roseovarius lutimaris]